MREQAHVEKAKTKALKKRGPVKDPPEDMPMKEGLEDYLYDWYTNRKDEAPKVAELVGEGNMCAPSSKKGDQHTQSAFHYDLPRPRMTEWSRDYLEQLDPRYDKKKDMKILAHALGEEEFYKYKNEVSEKGKHRVRFPDVPLYPDHARLNAEYDAEVQRKMQRAREKGRLFQGESQFKPSIPQSVINMVLKNIARKGAQDGGERGLMAWHSTGSGKTCTATGVMDSFWDTDRLIVFASSIDAIASNPDYTPDQTNSVTPK